MTLPPQGSFGFCASCGAPRTSADMVFCPNCGAAQALAPAQPPAPAFVPPPAGSTPPGAPPAPYYGQPAWNGAPAQAAPVKRGINPLLILVGIVIIALLAGGAYLFATRSDNKGPGASASPAPTAMTGISFSQTTFDCSAPVDMTMTARLPSTVKSGDTLTIKFDTTSLGTYDISPDSTTTLKADGSWVIVTDSTATEMQADCGRGGLNAQGVGVLTPGTHTYQMLDATSKVLAQGSYKVTGSAATPTPTPTPTLAPPPASTGSITFSPSTMSCASPAAFTTRILLPSSVQSGDAITEKLDGTDYAQGTVTAGSVWTHQADGTWLDVSTDSLSAVSGVCSTDGYDGSTAIFTSGDHTVQIVDADGNILAEGSYTVQ